MPTFRYQAKRGPKDVIEGNLEADNRQAAIAKVSALGYIPVKVTAVSDSAASSSQARPIFKGKIAVRHLNQFTRQFASLMRSQVPLLRTLSILKEQSANQQLQSVIEAVREDVRQGQTLSQALSKHPKVFSSLYVSLTRAGEIAGTLDMSLERLADQAERDENLRSKVQAALAYPLFVMLVGLGTVIFLLTFVMPRLIKLFNSFGGTLPVPTRILLGASALCQSLWFWGVIFSISLLFLLVFRLRASQMQVIFDRVSIGLPIVGSVIKQLELARFCRSLGLLITSGVPILQAADVSIPIVRSQLIRQSLYRLPAALKEGSSLAACMGALPIAPPFVVHTIAVGEEGGRVGEALAEIANYYERELERLLHVLSSLLEPVMILIVGGIVGFIVMAVLLPVFEMSIIAK